MTSEAGHVSLHGDKSRHSHSSGMRLPVLHTTSDGSGSTVLPNLERRSHWQACLAGEVPTSPLSACQEHLHGARPQAGPYKMRSNQITDSSHDVYLVDSEESPLPSTCRMTPSWACEAEKH